uniref:Si:ch211-67e16.11 n=1 Tax=Cyprinodon variegatus TaxID=28743 RepID=A0A3Q2DM86_CYPVA
MLSSKLRGSFNVGRMLNRADGSHRLHQPLYSSSAHDVVMVLDPSPGENFGHPVFLFYLDMNVTKKRCSHLDGIYLEECLTLALKGRCQNQLKRRQTGPQRLFGPRRMAAGTLRGGTAGSRLLEQAIGGFCEVHFLPLVVAIGDSSMSQRLKCVNPEFARCPQQLPMSSPSLPVSSCELNKNTRRCHQQPLATHLSCRLYQTCDHAVLISGWQPQMTFQHHLQNLQRFYRVLRNNGFHKDHIKTFFASSGQLLDLEGVYSATEKAVIRNHVSYICRKQHCADTLVLYLNSPTRTDGTMLLWDANLNGIADLKERYSVSELLADLAGCRAVRVLLFVDQSYSGVLSKRLRSSQKHHNVGLLNVTLAGAPCNATPPLTDSEMRREYQGCQNLPTALWYQK